MDKKKRICKYSGCVYYNHKAKTYCCGACSSDAYDHDRLRKEAKNKKDQHRGHNILGGKK